MGEFPRGDEIAWSELIEAFAVSGLAFQASATRCWVSQTARCVV